MAEVLSQRELYDGADTLDPIEPGYDGGRPVGKLFLLGPQPVLHSFARGETKYRLVDAIKFVTIASGKLARAVDETLDILRKHPCVFDRAGDLALVEYGRIRLLDQHSLAQFLGGIVQYRKFKAAKSQGPNSVDIDPPPDLAKRILAMGKGRGLNTLEAVTNVPTLRPDGSVLRTPGYDHATGLFLHLPDVTDALEVPERPSADDVRKAVERLMVPFQEFPFAATKDKSALFAALLTAAVRVGLPTAPAFGFDAPVQGSGKTLLATCVAMLVTGAEPRVFPHTGYTSDDEIRKRLFAFLRSCEGAMVWDNILGSFDSASFAAALTSRSYSDRILGRSENETVPNRALMLLTGNNLTLKGDMARRVLICRIDPREERPQLRAFNVYPRAYVEENRLELILACLTILRGWLTSGAARSGGRVASFEAWDDWVRQAVIWIGRDIMPGAFIDPAEALGSADDTNPDLEMLGDLLTALSGIFHGQSFTAKDVTNYVKGTGSKLARRISGEVSNEVTTPTDLGDLLEQYGDKARTSPRSLGRVFSNHKDKIVDGLVLRAQRDRHMNQTTWWIERLE